MPNTHPHQRGTDRIFEDITIGKAVKFVAGLAAFITAVGIIATTIGFFLVTKPELKEVKDSLSTSNKRAEAVNLQNDLRFKRIELRQDTVAATIQLLPPIARVTCIQLSLANSKTIARAAKLPCDTL